MRFRTYAVVCVALSGVLTAVSPALAQGGAAGKSMPMSSSTSDSRLYAAFGYMGQFFGSGDNYGLGLGIRAGYKVGKAGDDCIRAVGELGYYKGSDQHVVTFLGGGEVVFHGNPTFTPFAEALVGGARFTEAVVTPLPGATGDFSQTNLMTRFGGGVDIKVPALKKFDLRVGGGLATDYFKGGHNSGIELSGELKYKF